MKRIRIFILAFVCFFLLLGSASATTLKDLKNDLAKIREDKRINEKNSAATKAKLAEAQAELDATSAQIEEATKEKERVEEEIKELEKEIDVKKEQIKDLVLFYQLSKSRNFYLEYIFGADNFTDLIYRLSVIEQLTSRNDELVDEMNDLIKQNQAKIKELEAKQKELADLNAKILVQIQKLGAQSGKYFEEAVDIDEKIASAEKQIKFYEDQGCKDNDNLNYCINDVPPDTDMIRPTKHGVVTDNYGWRVSPCYGCSSFHKGMDIGGNSEGTPVLASAAGVVVAVNWYSCGGKVLTINHKVNGSNMATRYMHLYSIDVKEGDVVSQGQQVATVGGGNTAYYDSCSTGAHLHFEVMNGNYNAATYPGNVIDPRLRVAFPAYGVWW